LWGIPEIERFDAVLQLEAIVEGEKVLVERRRCRVVARSAARKRTWSIAIRICLGRREGATIHVCGQPGLRRTTQAGAVRISVDEVRTLRGTADACHAEVRAHVALCHCERHAIGDELLIVDLPASDKGVEYVTGEAMRTTEELLALAERQYVRDRQGKAVGNAVQRASIFCVEVVVVLWTSRGGGLRADTAVDVVPVGSVRPLATRFSPLMATELYQP